MFLAWNEIKHSKTRFALIIGVMVLVSYLVFFLVGLANGLAQANKTSVDKWDASGIVLTDESNTNIGMSMMGRGLAADIDAEEVAVLGQAPNVVRKKGETSEESKISVTFFGINKEEFIMPNVIEGRAFSDDYEIVADISLKEENRIEIGDQLSLTGTDLTVEVVGFTDNAQFSVGPVLYTTVNTYQDIRFENIDESESGRISAIVVRDQSLEAIKVHNEDLRLYSIGDYINKIPGYTAQVLTFGLMIGFLIVIAAVVIGIFMYVLTVQKSSMFGIMKAQGISTGYIAKSVVAQTFILAVIGVGIGLALTLLTALFLPAVVPFQSNSLFLVAITGLLILFAITGAFFSVRTVAKIDPLEAMG
ncbi:putative ABC transporter permease [Jeotgalibaca dankookensis]|uniref:Putative hemin transport system permease protein HrtB n=1 Tax=Jeotgalibaca dankookensis TaxID=708126 RepID=A0A1S6IQU7_9LACT|nr:ABC transporter permease [Jeotgalibaca dankookensis]AQS53899.1 putative ABC transporter permease [Jeotgalibaca dankookensis]